MNDETPTATETPDLEGFPVPDGSAPEAPQIPVQPVETATCESCGATIDVRGIEPFSRVACPSCGAEREIPGRFAHFLLLKHLGTGGMGTTIFYVLGSCLLLGAAVLMITRKRMGREN